MILELERGNLVIVVIKKFIFIGFEEKCWSVSILEKGENRKRMRLFCLKIIEIINLNIN